MKVFKLIIITIIISGFNLTVWADNENPFVSFENKLLRLMNQARQNPLEIAEYLGMDTQKVLNDFPNMQDILLNGIPPLTMNDNLCNVAAEHNNAMLNGSFYAHESPNGTGYEARIASKGYEALSSGETLGMISFANFIDPETAANLLFINMFTDELDPLRTEQHNILNPELRDVGISFGAGVYQQGGISVNVYMVTCNFASDLRVLETMLLEKINAARANPVVAILDLGLDDIIKEVPPEFAFVFEEGLSPFISNPLLYQSATLHTIDMLTNNYFSHDSLPVMKDFNLTGPPPSSPTPPWGKGELFTVQTYTDRIKSAGYKVVLSGEIVYMAKIDDLNDKNIQNIVKVIFKDILKKEFDMGFERNNIINPGLDEIGVSLWQGEFKDGATFDVFMITIDFGYSTEE